MLSAAYARTAATYNSVMNTRFYTAAAQLSDAERKLQRGAFWGSIHGTLSHLLWADRMWMSRFDDWVAPIQQLAESDGLFSDFEELRKAREDDDRRITAWAASLAEAWLVGDQTWFSGASQRELTLPRTLLVMHLFNHQTHHRGQVHAMLTACGLKVGDTDLPLVLAAPSFS